jgi:predicted nucleotidyltransferase
VARPETSIFKSDLQPLVLGLLLLNPQQTWTTREITNRLDAPGISVHRELRRALEAGFVTRKPVGRTYLYQAAVESPLYEPLRLLLERTVGVEIELRRALEGMSGVDAAFIHGSFAKGTKIRPTSDVDVLVLGDVDPRLLRRRLRRLEDRTGREIDILAYTPKEFLALADGGNSFARNIISGPVIPLVGSPEALHAA